MASHVSYKNTILGLMVLVGLAGMLYEASQYREIAHINQAILTNAQFDSDTYPYQQRFATAYHQANRQQYMHAIDIYNLLLLESNLSPEEQARVHYNIGNNLFILGLIRKVNEDGTLIDDARISLAQAKLAYEQSLRMAPTLRPTKLNLSLLNSVLPEDMQSHDKEQSTVELSNLPVGLP